jgi:ABC-2 type transport system permease protein
MTAALRHTWYMTVRHLRALFRQPAWVALTLIQPIIWILLYGQLFKQIVQIPGFGAGSYIDFLTPGIVVMTVLFSGGWAGMGLIWDLDNGVIDRFLVTPVSRGALIGGRLVQLGLVAVIQSAILVSLGLVLGARYPELFGLVVLVACSVLLGAAFASLSTGLAAVVRKEETVIAAVNFVILPLTFLSSVFMAQNLVPGWIRSVARFNPVNWAVVAGREALTATPNWGIVFARAGYLLVFATVCAWLATRAFRAYQRSVGGRVGAGDAVRPTPLSLPLLRPAEQRALHDVEGCDRREEDHPHGRADDRDERRRQIDRRSGRVAPGDPPNDLGVVVRTEQPRSHRGIEPQRVEQDRHENQGDAVGERRGPGPFPPDVFSDQPRGERREGHEHQEPDVQEQEHSIGPVDLRHHRVVVHPDDPDGEERDRVGRVGRPDLEQSSSQVGNVLGNLRVHVQDQQRCGDGEHAVGEGLQSVRVHRSASGGLGRGLGEQIVDVGDQRRRLQRAEPLACRSQALRSLA